MIEISKSLRYESIGSLEWQKNVLVVQNRLINTMSEVI